MSTTLPRDVLKWIQSLDLSHSVKNVKRDFSNGFLFAEILSRYYPSEIPMRAFENATSMEKKLQNWELLEKLMRKVNFAVSRDQIERLLHNDQEAAVEAVQSLYTFLTKKEIKKSKPEPQPTVEVEPTMINMMQSMALDHGSRSGLRSFQHSAYGGLMSPFTRSNATSRGGLLTKTAPIKAVSKEVSDDEQPIQFQDVELKSVDKSVALLRSRKRAMSSRTSNEMLSAGGYQATYGMSGASTAMGSRMLSAGRTGVMNTKNGSIATMNGISSLSTDRYSILLELNTIVESRLQSDASGYLESMDHHRDYIISFLEMAAEGTIPLSLSQTIFRTIREKLVEFVDIMVSNPREFWKFVTVFCEGLNLSETTQTFSEVFSVFGALGDCLLKKDHEESWRLYTEYLQPRLIPQLLSVPAKRPVLLSLMYRFCKNEAQSHITAIRDLNDAMAGNMDDFLHLLSVLIHRESELNSSPKLLDLYFYYCRIGLSKSSPQTRASCLSMIPLIIRHNNECILPSIEAMQMLISDSWWEVTVQLVLACIAILMEPANDSESDSQSTLAAYHILAELLTTQRRSSFVTKIALVNMSPLIGTNTSLCDIFVACLLIASPSDRESLLQLNIRPDGKHVDEVVHLSSSNSRIYEIYPLTRLWNALAVVQALMRYAATTKLQNFDKEHFDILFTALYSPSSSLESELDQWITVLTELRNLIYVALCDESICELASHFLTRLYLEYPQLAIPTISTLLPTLELIFPNGTEKCQQSTCSFLQQATQSTDHEMQRQLAQLMGRITEQRQLMTTWLAEVVREYNKTSSSHSVKLPSIS